MSSLKTVIVAAVVTGFIVPTMETPPVNSTYSLQRNQLLSEEVSTFFGNNITLSERELQVNKLLLREKLQELTAGYKNSSTFLPSLHFFHAKERINKSPVFSLIRRIPKGASLHTHLLAAVSVDFLISNISYRDHLYGGHVNGVFKLKFLSGPLQDARCNWTLLQEMRNRAGAPVFDDWLREQLLLNVDDPRKTYPNVESVWKKFKSIFTSTYDLVSHKPTFETYIAQLLQELYDDNVMYTELKGTIMPLYELDGTIYTKQQFFEIFIECIQKFKKDHPNFIGARYIHCIYRGVSDEILENGLAEIIELKKLFPDFIAGLDFVGYEEEGNPYSNQLLKAKNHINFLFHAGESNWFGHTDQYIADAILLNASRIGHGFAITKHPKLLRLGKERNIPLEVCPISNQVLMLNEDPRNHPAAVLMAYDYPIVVGNDDPSLWNATGLSYDWYILFMAMTPKNSGLEVLKQLAINSIVYSLMEPEEKNLAIQQWEQQWEEFINGQIESK